MKQAGIGLLALLLCGCNPQATVPPQHGTVTPPATTAAAPVPPTPAPQAEPAQANPTPPTRARAAATPALVRWGPKATTAGTGFNLQPDGSSALSFSFDRAVPPGATRVLFDERALPGAAAGGAVVTATVPADALRAPATHRVVVVLGDGARVDAGDFTIH